jgi:DNA-binding NarL/FixJ family response regulator
MSQMTRIVLADDHPIVLNGLRNLIVAENDFELVGEACSGLAALSIIRETQPDLAVVDISMPGLSGIGLTRRIASEMPAVRIMVLTLHEDRAFVKQALDAGARGYVLKRAAAESLVQAIRAVMVGGLYVDPAVADRIFDLSPKRAGQPNNLGMGLDLTERESEVIKLFALGFTNKEIASQLGVSIKSVETYKARGAAKLGVKTRAELVRYAAGQGWLAQG